MNFPLLFFKMNSNKLSLCRPIVRFSSSTGFNADPLDMEENNSQMPALIEIFNNFAFTAPNIAAIARKRPARKFCLTTFSRKLLISVLAKEKTLFSLLAGIVYNTGQY